MSCRDQVMGAMMAFLMHAQHGLTHTIGQPWASGRARTIERLGRVTKCAHVHDVIEACRNKLHPQNLGRHKKSCSSMLIYSSALVIKNKNVRTQKILVYPFLQLENEKNITVLSKPSLPIFKEIYERKNPKPKFLTF